MSSAFRCILMQIKLISGLLLKQETQGNSETAYWPVSLYNLFQKISLTIQSYLSLEVIYHVWLTLQKENNTALCKPCQNPE